MIQSPSKPNNGVTQQFVASLEVIDEALPQISQPLDVIRFDGVAAERGDVNAPDLPHGRQR